VQKDKIQFLFDFLLTTEEDMRAFTSFIKVVGNECFITRNKDAVKSFKSFIKQVCQIGITVPKFAPLLQMIFSDIIEGYRKQLSTLLSAQTSIAQYFLTESQASQIMNPYVVLPFVKYTLQLNGFKLIEDNLHDLVSVLMVVNTVFYEDYLLKDKYWQVIVRILDLC
jgi:hypothetical protein